MCQTKEEDMSSYSEGQVHQLMDKLEAEGYTPDDIRLLGQSKQLHGILSVLHGFAEIVAIKHVLKRQPFNPEKFLGKGWRIDEQIGQRTGDSLDAEKIIGKTYLNEGESSLNGEERLRRIKATPADVHLDAEDFFALWQEKGHTTLKWLYDTKGITFLSFWATILRSPGGDRSVLCLYRGEDGSWDWTAGSALTFGAPVIPRPCSQVAISP